VELRRQPRASQAIQVQPIAIAATSATRARTARPAGTGRCVPGDTAPSDCGAHAPRGLKLPKERTDRLDRNSGRIDERIRLPRIIGRGQPSHRGQDHRRKAARQIPVLGQAQQTRTSLRRFMSWEDSLDSSVNQYGSRRSGSWLEFEVEASGVVGLSGSGLMAASPV
jgi:hypothetical protein